MQENTKKFFIYLGHVMLTALASAMIAMLQNYLTAHTGHPTNIISPEQSGAIGAGLGTTSLAINKVRNVLF